MPDFLQSHTGHVSKIFWKKHANRKTTNKLILTLIKTFPLNLIYKIFIYCKKINENKPKMPFLVFQNKTHWQFHWKKNVFSVH